jgi:hypothetical protein
MKNYDVIIVGAGFLGIYAAWRLAKCGCRVILLEANNFLGGNLNSRQWKNFWLDNGTHNFDMRTKLEEKFFLDILGKNIQVWTDHNWASTTDKTWTYGFEMPDFSKDAPILSNQALAELKYIKESSYSALKPDHYSDALIQSHGPVLSTATLPLVRKFTGSDPTKFSVDARQSLTIFDRPKLGTDSEMIALKKSDPFWDKRLGVSLLCGDKRFYGKSVTTKYCYPADQGLHGFCVSAQQRLVELGVSIKLGHSVTDIKKDGKGVTVKVNNASFSADNLFWSLPETGLNKILKTGIDLTQSFIPVGVCLFAFEVPKECIKGPDYLHDFHPDRATFRYNKMGVYSQQIQSNGNTVVMAEVPSHPADLSKKVTNNMTKIVWENVCNSGFVAPETQPIDSTCWGLPVAFTLPKVGWKEDFTKVQDIIKNTVPSLHSPAFESRGRSRYMSYYETHLHHQLQK